MGNIDEIINEICKEKNYEQILVEIVRNDNVKYLNNELERISSDFKINEEQKKKIYKGIYDYIDQVNMSFKNNIENIYRVACKDTIEKILKNKIV